MPTIFAPLQIGSLEWTWRRTLIMGVVNVTPDSFFDGGKFLDPTAAVDHAMALVEAGADVLDVGGESTRPGAAQVSEEQELERVIPVIEAVAARSPVALSVDTYKAAVAQQAVSAGAVMINDISGMSMDPLMPATAADSGAAVILGHLRGEPRSMQQQISFTDVVQEVADELQARVRVAVRAGLGADRLWIDPGIGFGKTAAQSLELLRASGRLRDEVRCPIMIGCSRKSFIGEVTGQPAEERLLGTCAAVAGVVMAGADAVRIHDVAQLQPAIQVADAMRRGDQQVGP